MTFWIWMFFFACPTALGFLLSEILFGGGSGDWRIEGWKMVGIASGLTLLFFALVMAVAKKQGKFFGFSQKMWMGFNVLGFVTGAVGQFVV